MQVRDVQIDKAGERSSLRANVSIASRSGDFELEVDWDGLDPDHDLRAGDALFAFLLVPAMACGETLDLGTLTVSQRLLGSANRIQEIFRGWSRGLSLVSVRAAPEPRRREGEGSALFFSGGIDSWYTLLNAERLTHLIFLVGFDISENHSVRLDRARRTAQQAAERFGAKLVTSRANLRELSDPLVEWSLYHGGPLAGTALGLGADLTGCLISSSNSPESVGPWGSHPGLDSLWSTESLTIAHTGFEQRISKIRRVAEDELAMRTLRVCWHPVDEYNCGRCPKCTLVMAALHLIGKLQDAATLPSSVDLDALAAIRPDGSGERVLVMGQLLRMAEEQGDEEIARALRKARRGLYLRPRRYIDAAGLALGISARRRARLRR